MCSHNINCDECFTEASPVEIFETQHLFLYNKYSIPSGYKTNIFYYCKFPGGSAGKTSTCDVGDLGSLHGLGRSPRKGIGYPLQYSGMENPHGQRSLVGYTPWVAQSQTQLSN